MAFPLLAAGGAGPHIDPAYPRRVYSWKNLLAGRVELDLGYAYRGEKERVIHIVVRLNSCLHMRMYFIQYQCWSKQDACVRRASVRSFILFTAFFISKKHNADVCIHRDET